MEHLRRSYSIAIAALLVFMVVIVSVYIAYTSPTGIKARLNSDIHSITEKEASVYTNLEGETTDFLTTKDAILIVNIWATWSPYTAAEFEILADLKKEFGDAIRIVALNRMEAKETAIAFLNTIGKPVGIEYVLDQNDDFFKTIGGYAMPETLVFDSVGNIYFHKRGTTHSDELREAIASLVTE